MASNEERARLLGWKLPTTGKLRTCEKCGWKSPESERPLLSPSFDTDANACAELRAFVRARGKIKRFQLELWNVVLGCVPLFEPSYEQEFNLIDATPQQLCAAFDATFKDELEKIQ